MDFTPFSGCLLWGRVNSISATVLRLEHSTHRGQMRPVSDTIFHYASFANADLNFVCDRYEAELMANDFCSGRLPEAAGTYSSAGRCHGGGGGYLPPLDCMSARI
jgi:hypothetical protein